MYELTLVDILPKLSTQPQAALDAKLLLRKGAKPQNELPTPPKQKDRLLKPVHNPKSKMSMRWSSWPP